MLLEHVDMLINKHSLTRAELERKLGFSAGSIRNWGKNTPSVDKIQKVADYFNVSTDYLLGREEIKMTESDLSRMIDNAMSFDGKPLSENDREIARAYLEGKFGLK